jgi:hypothetical protein
VNIWITDVSQQMHAIAAPPSKVGRGGANGGKGLLAPLLFVEAGDTPPPPAASLIGMRVRRRFPMGEYVGTVDSYDPTNGYHLEYSDGDEEDMDVDDLLALPLEAPAALVGRRVTKHFPGHGRFEGSVTACDDPEAQTFTILYDDGDGESRLPLAEVYRLLLPSTSKGRAKKRGGGKKRARANPVS